MAETLYQYANKVINNTQLETEIKATATIVVGVSRIETVGTDVFIYMKDVLESAEQTALNLLVTNHVARPFTVELKNVDGAPIVESALRRGALGSSNFTIVSPDFSDRTNWYQKSVEVVNETLTTSDNLTYASVNPHWINIRSEKLTLDYKKVLERDGTLSAESKRFVVVRVDNVVKVEGTDYTVNYPAGTITFLASQSGTVTATYWHNNGVANCSEFLLTPPTGFGYRIHHIECQFSKNASFATPIRVEIWAGATTTVNNKKVVNVAAYSNFNDTLFNLGYGQSRSVYRNTKDLINWCTNSYPMIPACGTLTNDVMCFPFLYIIHPEISSAAGTLVRLVNDNDTPVTAEIATVTFYMEKFIV
jgi:hypothetical protein